MKMSEEKKREYEIKRWSENRERALNHKWYATGRIDLLIVSISGAGIYIGFELIKFIITQDIDASFGVIKFALASFTLAIVVNFISQFFGYNSNNLESKFNNIELKNLTSDEKKDEKYQAEIDCKIKVSNRIVSFCNISSSILMIIGILLLVIFNLITY